MLKRKDTNHHLDRSVSHNHFKIVTLMITDDRITITNSTSNGKVTETRGEQVLFGKVASVGLHVCKFATNPSSEKKKKKRRKERGKEEKPLQCLQEVQ